MKKTALFACLLASSALAQQQPLNSTAPTDTESILKELDKIKESRDLSAKNQLNKLYQTVSSAAASNSTAMDVYLQATYTTQFDGQSHEQTIFQDWKKKEAAKFKSKGFQDGLHLYFVYLGLTLQSASGVKNADMVPALLNYINQVQFQSQGEGLKDAKDFMQRSVTDSIVVRQAGVTLAPQENWVTTPANTEEMYQKVILPVLRDKKDPAALNYWNQKIEQEIAGASYMKNQYDIDHFANIRKPTLLWGRALEYYLIGQKDRGYKEMLAVIRAYPTHPDADQWAAKLKECLSK